MEDLERHEMRLERTHPSGAEEWHCPTCGRRFLMRWPPTYSKIVLEPGDEYAIHSGGKGGVQMGAGLISTDGLPLAPQTGDDGLSMEFLTDLALSDAPAAELLAEDSTSDDPDAAEPDIELSESLLAPWRRFIDSSDS